MANSPLTFGELFAGISGFGSGFERAGMKCVWQVEKDADCNRVLSARFPNVKRYADVTKVEASELEPVDLICFGWPCQDLSVAGLRAGISGERSGLFHEAARIISELRPKWIVAENVPGLFSSYTPIDAPPSDVEVGTEWEVEEDSDFETVLATLTELGYCVSWRVCDAQFWGVAQRRERVFIVGSLGTTSSLQVFPFAESLPGDFETRRETRTGTAEVSVRRAQTSRGGRLDVAGTIQSHAKRHDHAMTTQQAAESNHLVATSLGEDGELGGRLDPNEQNFIVVRSEGADASEDGTGRGTPIVVANFDNGQGDPNFDDGSLSYALNGQGHQGVAVKQESEIAATRNSGGFRSEPGEHLVACEVWNQTCGCGGKFTGPLSQPCPHCGEIREGMTHGDPVVATAYRTAGNCGPFEQGDITAALNTATDPNQNIIAFSSKDHGADAGEIAPTLQAQNFKDSHINGGGQVTIAFAQNQRDEVRLQGDGTIAGALSGEPGMKQQTYIATDAVAFESRVARNGRGAPSDIVPPLESKSGQTGKGDSAPLIAFDHCLQGSERSFIHRKNEKAQLQAGRPDSVAGNFGVRRLTPTECCRLQGFPDTWFDDENGKKILSDSAMYRCLGNAVAVPVAMWIGRRIVQAAEQSE